MTSVASVTRRIGADRMTQKTINRMQKKKEDQLNHKSRFHNLRRRKNKPSFAPLYTEDSTKTPKSKKTHQTRKSSVQVFTSPKIPKGEKNHGKHQNICLSHCFLWPSSCHHPTGSLPGHARALVPPSVRRTAPYVAPCFGHGCGHAPGAFGC